MSEKKRRPPNRMGRRSRATILERQAILRYEFGNGLYAETIAEIVSELARRGHEISKAELLRDMPAVGIGKVGGRWVMLPAQASDAVMMLFEERLKYCLQELEKNIDSYVVVLKTSLGGGPFLYYPLKEIEHPFIQAMTYTDHEVVVIPYSGKLEQVNTFFRTLWVGANREAPGKEAPS